MVDTARRQSTVPKEAAILADGNLELSDDERRALGVGPGDRVVVLTTDNGLVVTTRGRMFLSALEGIGAALREAGVTLEELMESGAKIREELVEEFYPRRTTE